MAHPAPAAADRSTARARFDDRLNASDALLWTIERDPVWSPDGKSLAFAAAGTDGFDVYVAPSGGGTARRLTSLAGDERWPSWTRDGRLVFAHRVPRGVWQLHIVSASAPGEPARFSDGPFAEYEPAVSPDGARVAFVSDRDTEGAESGDIWVRDLPAVAGAVAQSASPAPVRVTRGGNLERRRRLPARPEHQPARASHGHTPNSRLKLPG